MDFQLSQSTIANYRYYRETMDIERLLIWTYRDQCAASGGVGGGGGGYDSCVAVINRAAIGTSVDCAGYSGGPSRLDPDADLVHDVVLSLGGRDRGFVIQYAKTGTRPDWMPGAVPRPYGIDRKTDMPVAQWPKDKKPKPVMIYHDEAKSRPSHCVLVYDPLPEHIAFKRAVWVRWWDLLDVLTDRLDGALNRKVLMVSDPREPWLVDRGLTSQKLFDNVTEA